MEFNRIVLEKLFPVLQKDGFEIVEEFQNILRFESPKMKVNVVYNEYDRSNFIELGKRGETLYQLNDSVIKRVFNSELMIDEVIPEVFVENLNDIFQQKEGAEILKGNINYLVYYIKLECHNYTNKLVQNQILNIASKAWDNKDFRSFVDNIDKIEIEKIPHSFQLKYKIAKQKLEDLF